MPDLIERRLVRPDGTVVYEDVSPADAPASYVPERGFEIEGLVLSQRRLLPDGEWVTTAEFRDGYPCQACQNYRRI